jgi:hypothetical protein
MIHRAVCRVLLLSLAVSAATIGLRAGDDLVVDGGKTEPPDETVRFAPVVVRNIGGRVLGGPVAPATEYDLGALFDQHVFRRPGGRRQVLLLNGRMVVQGGAASFTGDSLEQLAYLRPLAERRIDSLDRICRLTEPQLDLLRLAAESDLRRLAGEIDAVRRNHAGQRLAATPQGIDRDRLQAVRDDAAACRQRIDRFFRGGSLLDSVGRGVLSPPQRSVFEAWLAARRQTRWEAMVRTVLDQIDAASLGFSAEQHDAILDQLLADVPALEVFGDEPEAATSARTADFQTLLVLSRLQRLDHEAVRKRCDPRQWLMLEQLMAQQGDPEAVEQLLVAQGVLQEDG